MQSRPVIQPKKTTPPQLSADALLRTAERKVAERLARLLETLQTRLDSQETAILKLQTLVGVVSEQTEPEQRVFPFKD